MSTEHNSDSIVVRPPRLRDYGAFCEIFAAAHRSHYDDRPDLYREMQPREIVPFLKMYGPLVGLAQPWLLKTLIERQYFLRIAEHEGIPVGAVLAQSEDILDYGRNVIGKQAYLDNIAVHSIRARLGAGAKLLDEVKIWAGEQKLTHIYGKVLEGNTVSQAFLKANGFAPESYVMGCSFAERGASPVVDISPSLPMNFEKVRVDYELRSSLSWSNFNEQAVLTSANGSFAELGEVVDILMRYGIEKGADYVRAEVSADDMASQDVLSQQGFKIDFVNMGMDL